MADSPKTHLVTENAGPARLQGRTAVHLNAPAAERQRRDRALKTSEIRYRRLFESAPYGILVLDAETGVVVDVNPAMCRMLDCEHEDVVDQPIWAIPSFKNAAATKNHFRDLLSTPHIRYDDLPLETKPGRIRHVELVGTLFLAENKQFVQCTVRDITERVQREHAAGERARQVSAATDLSARRAKDDEVQDQATGLVNRSYLEEALPRELHRAARSKLPLTVTVLAIDRLAELRQTNGDDTVNALLREVGRVIAEHLRKSDMASRYTDAQFVLVLPQSSPESTRERLEQMGGALRTLELVHGKRRLGAGLTLSAGVATAGVHGTTTRELLEAACAALRQAQQAGGDRALLYQTKETTR